MPEVVQTGMSAAIDFLGGFGRGMVQADINRRENEKLDLQKQKWKQEMTAYAAQDELRKMQAEQSRLEVDIRKTQFADIKATREQTKGFVGFMADAIGKAKGNPAEKQSQLLEAYTQGAAQFTQADMGFGDMLIDQYSKIHQADAPKAWEFRDIKDNETGKKRTALFSEHGDIIRYLKGEENLEIVNDKIAQGIKAEQDEFNTALQAFFRGQTAVLGSEGQSLNIDDFMKSVENLNGKDKSRVTMDWIFDVRDRLLKDIHEKAGPLDQRIFRLLTPVVHNEKAREEFAKPYARVNHMAGVPKMLDKYSAENKLPVIARMVSKFEALLPEYEMGPVRLELARLQNKAEMEIKNRKGIVEQQKNKTMTQEIEGAKKQKDMDLLGQFATGVEGLQFGPKVTSPDWWASFLSGESGETESKEDTGSEGMETLNAMQEPMVKSFKLGR